MGDKASCLDVEELPSTIVFRNLPDDIPTFLCTGYTDLRKSISGLSEKIEEMYQLDSRSRCMTFFCGRRVDRFKVLMYNGDGYLVMTKRFEKRRLIWPRLGGKTSGELWWLSHENLDSLLAGNALSVDDIDDGEVINEPEINREKRTMYLHLLMTDKIPRYFYIITGYTDLRRSIDGYCEIIRHFGSEPQSNAFYLFCGKRSTIMKTLFYDGDGFLLITKQYTEGSLQWPRYEGEMWDVLIPQYRDLISGKKITHDVVLKVIREKKSHEDP